MDLYKYSERSASPETEIMLRGEGLDRKEWKKIRKALHALHTLEIMAVNIYRMQIGRFDKKLNTALIAGMANEMGHARDFSVKLYEYGMRPFIFRWTHWMAGCMIGLFARITGRNQALKVDIWVEEKACRHYKELIESLPWDDQSLKILNKDLADEAHHIKVWKSFQ